MRPIIDQLIVANDQIGCERAIVIVYTCLKIKTKALKTLIMKKQKLNLGDLKVSSFITEVSKESQQTALGGLDYGVITTDKTDPLHTIDCRTLLRTNCCK